jgi:HK97 gp10 family phage protein
MSVTAKMDFSGIFAGLDRLATDVAPQLLRSMAVAGGTLLRDEAQARAPVGTEEGGSKSPGSLRDSIYLAFRDGLSSDTRVVYSVSWNSKTAPHGHLLEFGHWHKPHTSGSHSSEGQSTFKWTPAQPFLRPAWDACGQAVIAAMLARGKERLPELLAGKGTGDVAGS